jgi:hypothetical protein
MAKNFKRKLIYLQIVHKEILSNHNLKQFLIKILMYKEIKSICDEKKFKIISFFILYLIISNHI